MPFRLSRRRWVMLLGSTPLLAQTAVQTPAPPMTPEQRGEKAKSDVRQVSDKLAAIEISMFIEPAFHFRA
jgi:hypothetical protein